MKLQKKIRIPKKEMRQLIGGNEQTTKNSSSTSNSSTPKSLGSTIRSQNEFNLLNSPTSKY